MLNSQSNTSRQVSGPDEGTEVPVRPEGQIRSDEWTATLWVGLHYINEQR